MAKTRIEKLGNGLFGYGLLGTFGILGYQAYTWLQTATWPALPVSLIWGWYGHPLPTYEWAGVQKIVDWLLQCPISALCLGVVVIGTTISSNRNT